MDRKFNDIFVHFLVIMKNVFISFIKEYRGPALRSPCDAIDDITMKNTFFFIIWDDLFISEVQLKLSLIFKMATILRSWQIFLPEVIPEVEVL